MCTRTVRADHSRRARRPLPDPASDGARLAVTVPAVPAMDPMPDAYSQVDPYRVFGLRGPRCGATVSIVASRGG
jgi:hypothetical protein